MHNYGKVAVLMGGTSAEREISLISGQAVLQALQRQGINATLIDTQYAVLEQLLALKPDRAFIVLHGRGGEDGTMQGLLKTLGIPFTGSDVLGSALGMDKSRTKTLWEGCGLPTPPSVSLTADTDWNAVIERLGLPIMVKPASEGSSVGMSKVDRAEDLPAAWQTAHQYDKKILAEQYITGKEYTAAILNGEALPLIRVETPARNFYDFTAKYQDNQTLYHCPCGLSPEKEKALQNIALQAFESVGASGWGRVDIMVDNATGNPFLLEINTVPGMTDHSLVPMAAKAAGIDFDELVCRILDTACA
jgi:D-alanine-D-alanine ligase